MRIRCWNMQHKRASWRFLDERRECADVALLQLDYVFASRSIVQRVSVSALNAPGEWGRATIAGS